MNKKQCQVVDCNKKVFNFITSTVVNHSKGCVENVELALCEEHYILHKEKGL